MHLKFLNYCFIVKEKADIYNQEYYLIIEINILNSKFLRKKLSFLSPIQSILLSLIMNFKWKREREISIYWRIELIKYVLPLPGSCWAILKKVRLINNLWIELKNLIRKMNSSCWQFHEISSWWLEGKAI